MNNFNPFLNNIMSYLNNNPNIFQQFAQNYKGDPKQDIQTMLNNGQLSQPMYNALFQMAKILSGYKPH